MDILKKEDPFNMIYGQKVAKQNIKSALGLKRHIIIIGPPGVGKTTMAKNISRLLPTIEVNDCPYNCLPSSPICPTCKSGQTQTKTIEGIDRFIRLQGSPDLVVEDILGDIDPIKALKFGPLSIEAFTPGKIFRANNGILFFDEINRCPEKLQNSLLQVLEEGQATIGSYDVDIDADFIFIGTMNPDDFTGTEKLSEVLLDRFDLVYMDHPESLEIETKIVRTKGQHLEVNFDKGLLDITLNFIRSLRASDKLEKVPSVRASLGLYERAQGNALIAGRKDVIFNDVVGAMKSVLAHRIKLKPSEQYVRSPLDFITDKLKDFTKGLEVDFDHDLSETGSSEGDVP